MFNDFVQLFTLRDSWAARVYHESSPRGSNEVHKGCLGKPGDCLSPLLPDGSRGCPGEARMLPEGALEITMGCGAQASLGPMSLVDY